MGKARVQRQVWKGYLVPQGPHSLHCGDFLEGDGEGVAGVPVRVGPHQAADLHYHLINCTESGTSLLLITNIITITTFVDYSYCYYDYD